MVKCHSCNEKVQETFLSKKMGTVRKEEGKKVWICSSCQHKEDTKQN